MSPKIALEPPSMRRAHEFIAAARRSTRLHRGRVNPPLSLEEYRAYVARFRKRTHVGHFVYTEERALAGVININEIVRGSFQSGYLGYYAFEPHAGRGFMREALRAVSALAFRKYGLHRLEANILPDNARSIALVRSLGFVREGYSQSYLKIAARWRDHERWAITKELWRDNGRHSGLRKHDTRGAR